MDEEVQRLYKTCHNSQVVDGNPSPPSIQRFEPPQDHGMDIATEFLGLSAKGKRWMNYHSTSYEVAIMRPATSMERLIVKILKLRSAHNHHHPS